MKEAENLRKVFEYYNGKTNKLGSVAIVMIVWNADRSELQMLTHTRKEGTYGTVSGWAVEISEAYLLACMICYFRLIQKMLTNEGTIHPTCKKCCNCCLDTTITGDDTQANDPVSKDYPTDYPTGDGIDPQTEGRTCNLKMLFPMKLNTDWMLQAVRSTYCGIHRRSWSKPQARE